MDVAVSTLLLTRRLAGGAVASGADAITLSLVNRDSNALVNVGLPLTQGLLTASQVNNGYGVLKTPGGTEVQVWIQPWSAQGCVKWRDGSERGVWIQCATADVPSGAVFYPYGTRTLSARTKTTVTNSNVRVHARLLPTDAQYLCDTLVTLQPQIPVASMSAAEQAYYNGGSRDFVSRYASAMTAARLEYDAGDGTWVKADCSPAIYNHHGMAFKAWCATGTSSYFTDAVDRAWQYARGSTVYAQLNPEGLPSAGVNELWGLEQWQNMNLAGMVMAYWLTGWEQFRYAIAHSLCYLTGRSTDFAKASVDGSSGLGVGYIQQRPRTSYGAAIYPLICGYLTGTKYFETTSLSFGQTSHEYATRLPWILDIQTDKLWTTSGYAQGFPAGCVELYPTSPDDSTGARSWQTAYCYDAYLIYYHNVNDDARISDFVDAAYPVFKSISRALTTWDYDRVVALSGSSSNIYTGEDQWGMCYDPPAPGFTSSTTLHQPQYITSASSLFALGYYRTSDSAYSTRYERALRVRNHDQDALADLRALGEFFNNWWHAPAYYRGAFPQGPSSLVEP